MNSFVSNINNQIADVVLWNRVAQNLNEDFSIEKVVKQAEYTAEELKETIEASLKVNHIQILDGVADVFVTATYLYRLLTVETLQFEEIDFLGFGDVVEGYDCLYAIGATAFELLGVVDLVKSGAYFNTDDDTKEAIRSTIYNKVVELLSYISIRYLVEASDVIAEVLASNWSKFVKAEFADADAIENQCRYIEQAYDCKDVVPVRSGDYIVFRDTNGTGKIRKPASMFHPDLTRFVSNS